MCPSFEEKESHDLPDYKICTHLGMVDFKAPIVFLFIGLFLWQVGRRKILPLLWKSASSSRGLWSLIMQSSSVIAKGRGMSVSLQYVFSLASASVEDHTCSSVKESKSFIKVIESKRSRNSF